MNTKEEDILHRAMEKLQQLSGVTAVLRNGYKKDGRGFDGKIELNFSERTEEFVIEIKNELRINCIPLIQRIKPANEAFLLICQYIPMPLKKELKELGINYLEAAGNCFIKTDKLFLFINDQQVTAARLPADGKLWKAAGLKFLFAVLRYPELLNKPYRQVAEKAGIALGNIGSYLEELRKEGFLKKGTVGNIKADFIENEARLAERWAEAYQTNLRPKEWVGRFRFFNQDEFKHWKIIQQNGFKWGGENAAALLTGFLHPEKFTLYITANRMDLMRTLKLVPDPQGAIELLNQFWPDDQNAGETIATVPPLLVYAELSTSYDSRNRETAERIKTKYLD